MKKNSLWQKIKDKFCHKFIKLAILSLPILGTNAGENTSPLPSSDIAKNKALTEKSVSPSRQNNFVPLNSDEIIAQKLLSEKQNIIGNFNLNDREFSAEDLSRIQQCPLNEQIIKTAKKNAKRGVPGSGQQTYCLGAVKEFYSANGIIIDAQRFAYRAVDSLQTNSNFTEINVNISDFASMPDGALMAWEKGTTRYGHIAMKIGNREYCDYVYNLHTNNRRGRTGQRYGKAHVFLLKQMPLTEDFTRKLIAEGRLKDDVRKRIEAKIKTDDMYARLKYHPLKTFDVADSALFQRNSASVESPTSHSQKYAGNQFDINMIKKTKEKSR